MHALADRRYGHVRCVLACCAWLWSGFTEHEPALRLIGRDLELERLQRGQEGVKLAKDLLCICRRQSCCTAAAASSAAAAPRVLVVRVPDVLPLTVCE